MLPYSKSKDMFNWELSREEHAVRGNLVTGLTKTDMFYLDHFEGSVRHAGLYFVPLLTAAQEYVLESVVVHPLGPLEALNHPSNSVVAANAPSLPDSLPEGIGAVTYMWDAHKDKLEPELWSYDVFIRDNAWKWVGPSADDDEYSEVDRRREANGIIDKAAQDAIKEGALN